MKINIIELCAGYSSQCLALDELKKIHPDFDYELVAWSEFDPESNKPLDKQPAVVAHNLLFPQWADRNLGDMTKIDWQAWKDAHPDTDVDVLVYSTPCQSISQAGLQHGFAEGSGTRSSILWNTIDAVRVLRPKYLLQENVAAIVNKKNIEQFHKWCSTLEQHQYVNNYSLMNSKDYGIPQNRLRMFMVSTRSDLNFNYEFPKPFKLEKFLCDILEQEVDESYFLCDESVEKFLYNSQEFKDKHDFYLEPTGKKSSCQVSRIISPSIEGDQDSIEEMQQFKDSEKDENGLPIYLRAPSGNIYKLEYVEDADGKHPRWVRRYTDNNGKQHIWCIRFRIRKLTPREVFRLMGVPEDRIDTLLTTERVPAKKGSTEMVDKLIISKSSLYKLAGNSIVVDCLKYIFDQLFYPTNDTSLKSSNDGDGQVLLDFDFE